MRILLVNWQDLKNPQAGGAELHLYEVFRRLHAQGHQVTWLVSGWRGAAARDEVDGMKICRTGTRYTFGAASVLFFRRHLRQRGFDILVEAINKVPVYSPLWSGPPVILLAHHLFGTTAFQQAPTLLAAVTWLQERPLDWVYHGLPVQAISHSTAEDLVARGLRAQDITVIHPGVDLDFFGPASRQRATHPTFVYVGRLQKYKRVDAILRGFAMARQRLEGARLVIAGKGDQFEPLRQLAAELQLTDAVDFEGFVSEERKRELFRMAWANVFMSPKEGWGITNLEAAACATPTIASDSPGLRESVIDGRTGLLVPPDELEALAIAFLRLGTERDLLGRLSAGALEFASGFSWDKAAAETERHLVANVRSTAGAR